MKKKSNSPLDDLNESLKSLKESLSEYYLSLNELVNKGTKTRVEFERSVRKTIKAYVKADNLLNSISIMLFDRANNRLLKEWNSKEKIIHLSEILAQSQDSTVRIFAASILVLATRYVTFFGALQANLHSSIFLKNTLPENLISLKKNKKRLYLWSLITIASAILAFFNFSRLITLFIACCGILTLIFDYFYINKIDFPGAELPGEIAQNISNAIPGLQKKIGKIDELTNLISNTYIEWPNMFTEALAKLGNGDTVDKDLLENLTSSALDLQNQLLKTTTTILENPEP